MFEKTGRTEDKYTAKLEGYSNLLEIKNMMIVLVWSCVLGFLTAAILGYLLQRLSIQSLVDLTSLLLGIIIWLLIIIALILMRVTYLLFEILRALQGK